MKHFAALPLILGVLTCPAFAQTSLTALAAPTAPAHVYVYRPHNKMYGNALHPTLSCDYNVVAKVPNGSFFEFDLDPGRYRMHVEQWGLQADATITAAAGHNYYLRLALVGGTSKALTGRKGGFQLIEIPEDEAKVEMTKLKALSPDKVTPPAMAAAVSGPAVQRVAFARELQDKGLRGGQDLSVVASGPEKAYLTIYMAVSKPILFQIGEDQATLDKIKAAGFTQFTVSDPSLRGYNPLGQAIGNALTGRDDQPGCNVAEECTRTWYF